MCLSSLILILVVTNLFILFLLDGFPSPCWVKINTDGAVRGSLGLSACGGIFRGSMRDFIGGFSAFLDI